jgi:Lrp/AsnC family leucine-responsive transcriptional regulator
LIDDTDRKLLNLLADDARLPVKDLARGIGLSSPATAERMRRLVDRGVIKRFTVEVDRKAIGFALEAVVRIKPLPAKVHILEKLLRDNPNIIECDKVTGDDCFVARIVFRSVEDIDAVLSEVADNSMSSTSLVKTKPVARRLPPLSANDK